MGAISTVTGGGTFTRQNINDINANFAAVNTRTPDIWIRPQNGGLDTNPGTYAKPLSTMAGASRFITPGIVIGVQGVLKEEFSGPNVADVTIVGYNSNTPRQATTSGAPNGGGATWLSPTGGTGALLTVNGQSWTVSNMFFNNSATAAACVKLVVSGTGDPPADPDASMFLLDRCWLTGTDDGLTSTGLPNYCTVQGCRFFGFSGSGDLGISYAVGAGVKTLQGWKIIGNEFLGNANHLTAALTGAEIAFNRFSYIYGGVTSTTQIILTGGSDNSVHNNYFDIPATTNLISTMFKGGTNDRWYFNQLSTAVATTIFSFAPPVS